MISWRGRNGDQFSFDVHGYQFPDIEEGSDANWIVVSVAAKNWSGEWRAREAIALAYDLLLLRDCFAADSVGMDGWTCQSGDMAITLLGESRGKQVIAVRLNATLARHPQDADDWNQTDFVVVDVDPRESEAAVLAIDSWMAAFPPRGRSGARGLAGFHDIIARRRAAQDEG